ncbi:mechanosensitive ion channel family protein [Pseudonocardia hispaniensis]|uniref:Mechanosensitive ion channel family protein n=1 Tax=Pseudonocardia hispaniensis TaxID=904933 RepID=A0ABW1J3B1_9PSEU
MDLVPVPPGLLPAQPSCAGEAGTWCARFYRWTNNDFLAASADAIMSKGSAIALIIVLSLLVRWLIHRAINRLIEGATNGRVTRLLLRGAPARLRAATTPVTAQRRTQRARTIGSVLRSFTSAVVLLVASAMVLGEFGVALGPILASAGIVGIAIGFGAQNLVRDFLSGMFMLLEDQYGVGDVVDLGGVNGTVEAVGLRITTVRDIKGTVWYVRNGEILRVGNMSQGYAVAVVDVPLAHTADTAQAIELADRIAGERLQQQDVAEDVIEPPQVLGVDKVTTEGVVLRLTVRVNPGRQFAVQRALNAAISDAFDEAGIPRPLGSLSLLDPQGPAGAEKGSVQG